MDKYGMIFNKKYNIDTKTTDSIQIGKIVDFETGEDALYLYYEKNEYLHSGLHFHVLISEFEDGKSYPMVIMDEYFKNVFYNNPTILFALAMHELGHYVNGDFEKKEDKDDVLQSRMKCLQEGKVHESEANADRYAVMYAGKSRVINALDLLIRRRKERSDPGMAIAIKEFELRKQLVKKMKV